MGRRHDPEWSWITREIAKPRERVHGFFLPALAICVPDEAPSTDFQCPTHRGRRRPVPCVKMEERRRRLDPGRSASGLSPPGPKNNKPVGLFAPSLSALGPVAPNRRRPSRIRKRLWESQPARSSPRINAGIGNLGAPKLNMNQCWQLKRPDVALVIIIRRQSICASKVHQEPRGGTGLGPKGRGSEVRGRKDWPRANKVLGRRDRSNPASGPL